MDTKELLKCYQSELGSSRAMCDDRGKKIWADIDCALIKLQENKEKRIRLDADNMQLKFALAEARSRFKQYEMDCDESAPDSHRLFMERIDTLLGR
ncbi:hypothetical protein [Sansalvadorimonas verongulae]|uniref:hypothetical protein n=1 Tax=Sansalvadorimonas verongulae TaxID=2172824 RepID=UPI0012BCFF04|nr:hypothetical protein [Sansalvadorimonas verongulae]MTI12827.1 hypothetical protein [Sansalvadorimonas verongulae]